MYKKIMVPVDIEHTDTLGKALSVAADLAAYWKAEVCYVEVGGAAPGSAGRRPEDYENKLKELADREAGKHGQPSRSKFVRSTDPAFDLERELRKEMEEEGADLVIMASHAPALRDRIFGSNASHVVNHSTISVLVVR